MKNLRQVIAFVALGWAALAAVFLLIPGFFSASGFALDDAWLHLAYGRALSSSGSFSFNPGDHNANMLSPAWSVLLALPHRLSTEILTRVVAVKLFGFSCHFAAAFGITRIVAHLGGSEVAAFSAGTLTLVHPLLLCASMSGIESGLASLMIVAIVFALLERRLIALCVAAIVIPWVRIDLSIFALLLIAIATASGHFQDKTRSSTSLLMSLGIGFVCALIWRISHDSALLPGIRWPWESWFPASLDTWMEMFRRTQAISIVDSGIILALLVGVSLWTLVRSRQSGQKIFRYPAWITLATLCCIFMECYFVGNSDRNALVKTRMLLPFVPLVLAMTVLMLDENLSKIADQKGRMLAIALSYLILVGSIAHDFSPTLRAFGASVHFVDGLYAKSASALREADDDDVAWMLDPGIARYIGNASIVGMLDPKAEGLHKPSFIEIAPPLVEVPDKDVPVTFLKPPALVSSYRFMGARQLIHCSGSTLELSIAGVSQRVQCH